MRTLGIVLIVQAVFRGPCYASTAPDGIFTENGRPIAYPTDEEIADQLAAGGEMVDAADFENWRKVLGSDVDVPWNQYSQDELSAGSKQEKRAAVRKREGQEEFPTFVDPAPSKRSVSGQFDRGGFEKRASVDKAQAMDGDIGDTAFIAVTTVCTAAAVFGLVAAAFVWRRVHLRHKAARDSDYPAYGITGPIKERSGSTSPVAMMDAKLASSAQLYHYQHTKQQIIAMEQSTCESKGHESEDSEGEEDEGDFSVYEYPGLASTGGMEVSNPLFENASPLTKTDPKLAQFEPRIHHRRFGEPSDDQ